MKYEYMVFYHVGSQNDLGRICVTRTQPIESYSDIEGIDEFLRDSNECAKGKDKSNLFVLDFKLLRTYNDEQGD